MSSRVPSRDTRKETATITTGVSTTLATSAAADDIIDTSAAHAFVAGDRVVFASLTGGTGLTTGTVYYVIAANLAATTFQVSATAGGAAIDFTTDITAGSIATAATLSGAVGTGGLELAAIITPAAWTAADLTFQALHDGTTYYNCYISTADTEVTIQADASRFITVPAGTLSGASSIKVRSGTAATPVHQAAARDVILIFRTAA